MSSKSGIQEFGWSAVPRNRSNIPSESQVQQAQQATSNISLPLKFNSIWPQTPLLLSAQTYIQATLPQETYNHSLRVYAYGHALLTTHCPTWLSSASFLETFALTTLYHDLGTSSENLHSTHLSFEFQSGYLALQSLLKLGAPLAQAESVAEAIIRHQDPGETGQISRMGQLIQLATELDNMGWRADLVGGVEVVEEVVRQHPRLQWTTCFAGVIEREIQEKPWCHTTAIEGFKEAVEGTEILRPYE